MNQSAQGLVSLGQEFLDLRFVLFVGALAEVLVADEAVRVDEVAGGPVAVVVGVPRRTRRSASSTSLPFLNRFTMALALLPVNVASRELSNS